VLFIDLYFVILSFSIDLFLKISDEIIARVKEAADVVEVVGEFVPLKRKGKYYSACCPFHQEKTPSFTVTPALGIYKCYGCSKAGDSIQFIMDHEGVGYLEAIKWLANKYNIEIPEDEFLGGELPQYSQRESLYIVLNYAKNFFQKVLFEHEDGRAFGLSYFSERGFNEATIRKFDLGYSLESWDALTKEALKDGYSKEILEKAGLITIKEDKAYDRFRGRVIFPIHNVSGKVIAFGARILKKDKSQAKYLNSPETEVYHKSEVLYGLYHAKQAIRQQEFCLLVEGYTDVISLHLSGIENVVASSGTSLTEQQIKLIGRYTKDITILYDGDSAGIKASLRGIDLILKEGLNVRCVVFPDGEDPDSYSQKIGSEAFNKYIAEQSEDFLTFKTNLFLKDAGKDPLKRAEVIREVVQSISLIPDAIKRSVFYKQCSRLLDIEESILITEGNKVQLTRGKDQKTEEQLKITEDGITIQETVEEVKKPSEANRLILQEKETIRLLLKYGNELLDEQTRLYQYIYHELEDVDFESPLYFKIFQLYHSYLQQDIVPTHEQFVNSEDFEIKSESIDLLMERYEISDTWESKFGIIVPKEENVLFQSVYSNILRLKYRKIQKLIQQNDELLQKAETFEEQLQYLHVAKELKNTKKELGELLGIVISF
jgi:DNA primase